MIFPFPSSPHWAPTTAMTTWGHGSGRLPIDAPNARRFALQCVDAMIDISPQAPPTPPTPPAEEAEPQTEDSWLDRARRASAAALSLYGRNPRGASVSGLEVEPGSPRKRRDPASR